MECPICKGAKQREITMYMNGSFTENGYNKGEPSVSMMECFDCDGTGEVDRKTMDSIEYERNMWCKCESDTIPDSTYYADGEHPQIHKHHYRCNECNKVTQIG